MNPKFSPSLMGMDLMNVQKQITELDKYAYSYHVDYIDWRYAKNMCLSPQFVEQLRKITRVPIDVHLMVKDLELDIIEATAKAGADIISIPAEEMEKNVFRYIEYIKGSGKKFGAVLCPATPLSAIDCYIDQIDQITFMGVTPGFARQKLVTKVLDKIKEAHMIRKTNGYHFLTQIDGGCHPETLKAIDETGVDIIVMGGTTLFSQDDDMDAAWAKMLNIYDHAVNG